MHHPVFQRFSDKMMFTPDGSLRIMTMSPPPPLVPHPALNEEYFEWIDLFEAVEAAAGRFCMLELGAGYGRWGTYGAYVANYSGRRPVQLTLVEAEPEHCAAIPAH